MVAWSNHGCPGSLFQHQHVAVRWAWHVTGGPQAKRGGFLRSLLRHRLLSVSSFAFVRISVYALIWPSWLTGCKEIPSFLRISSSFHCPGNGSWRGSRVALIARQKMQLGEMVAGLHVLKRTKCSSQRDCLWRRADLHVINPLTAPACNIFWLKSAHIHTCRQYIRWSYNKSTFNSCAFWYFLSRALAKWGKSHLNDFTFGIFIGRCPSDGAASMAVKGLKKEKGDSMIKWS